MVSAATVEVTLPLVVERLLAEAEITQTFVAQSTTIPLSTLNRRLRGAQPFTVTEVRQIADLLGVRPSSILGEAERLAQSGEAS